MVLDYFCFLFPSKNLVEIPFRGFVLEWVTVTSYERTSQTIQTATTIDTIANAAPVDPTTNATAFGGAAASSSSAAAGNAHHSDH